LLILHCCKGNQLFICISADPTRKHDIKTTNYSTMLLVAKYRVEM